jgi:hypothetical protein
VIVDALNAEMFGEIISSFRANSHAYQTIVKFEFGLGDPKIGMLRGNETVKHDMLQEYRQYLFQIQAYQVFYKMASIYAQKFGKTRIKNFFCVLMVNLNYETINLFWEPKITYVCFVVFQKIPNSLFYCK